MKLCTPFQELVTNELTRANAMHGSHVNSGHEGYAVLLEEVDELWDEVRKKARDRDTLVIVKELVQIAAMAEKMAVGLYPDAIGTVLRDDHV